jgi:hypothetical protein
MIWFIAYMARILVRIGLLLAIITVLLIIIGR